jgi:hypothetical protein
VGSAELVGARDVAEHGVAQRSARATVVVDVDRAGAVTRAAVPAPPLPARSRERSRSKSGSPS